MYLSDLLLGFLSETERFETLLISVSKIRPWIKLPHDLP